MNASLSRNPIGRTQIREDHVRIFPNVVGRAHPGALRRLWSRNVGAPVVIVNGHPDPRQNRFCAALCDSYAAGVRATGRDAIRLNIAALEWDNVFQDVRSAERVVIVYPLWLDRPPALVSSFFAKAARLSSQQKQSARVIITMDMPAFMHRALLRRADTPARLAGAVDLPGYSHALPTFIGTVATMTPAQRADWLHAIHALGEERRLEQFH